MVLAIRESNPTTPDELMFAVRTLFDIGRTDEAKIYLKKLVDSKPDRKTLFELHRKYHSVFFYQLMRDHRMKPEGEQVGKAVLDAAYEAAHDPARLKQLVKQLNDPLPGVRSRSIDALSSVETAALPPILEALADPQRQAEHAAIRTAILQLGSDVLDALSVVLDSPDDALRMQVIDVLARARHAQAVPYLVGLSVRQQTPAELRDGARRALELIAGRPPTADEMARYLDRRARQFYEGALPAALDYQDRATLWQWDAEQKRPAPRRYAAGDAGLIMATRLSADLYQLKPDNVDYRRLFLATSLESAQIENGLGRRLPKEHPAYRAAAAVGVAGVEDALAYTLQQNRPLAATGLAEILGDLGDLTLLRSADGRPRPLVQALRHGDRRLAFAAAEAVLRLDPRQPYAGSSYLAETLGYLIRTVGSRRVLVAHPRVERAQSLVGMLRQIGYEADAAQTGNDTFRQATQNPDYEFALLSDGLDRPAAHETIQMLRRDPRTRRLPVGLMAREENVRRGEEFATVQPLVAAFPRPHDVASLAFLAGRLTELGGRELVPYDERLDQARAAVEHLVRLATESKEYGFYDLHRQLDAVRSAVFTPELADKAAQLLGLIGSPEAQRTLVAVASQPARPLELRQAAAKSLLVAVQRYGLLLTREEILQQYDRYNRSAKLDEGTQQVLGAVLDAIEWPSKKAQAAAPGKTPPEKPATPPQDAADSKPPAKAERKPPAEADPKPPAKADPKPQAKADAETLGKSRFETPGRSRSEAPAKAP